MEDGVYQSIKSIFMREVRKQAYDYIPHTQ